MDVNHEHAKELAVNKNAGFGPVGIVLAIVFVALIGAIGWRLYEANKAAQGSTANQSSNSQTQNNASANSRADAEVYLDIKELGIKIKLSKDISDAIYYYDASALVARVSTQAILDKSGGACTPRLNAPFGSLIKTQTLDQPNGVTLKVDNTNIFQFGSDYVIYSTPNQPCSTDTSVTELQTAQLASFKRAIMTMQRD